MRGEEPAPKTFELKHTQGTFTAPFGTIAQGQQLTAHTDLSAQLNSGPVNAGDTDDNVSENNAADNVSENNADENVSENNADDNVSENRDAEDNVTENSDAVVEELINISKTSLQTPEDDTVWKEMIGIAWNANSYSANKEMLFEQIRKHNANTVLLNETWMNEDYEILKYNCCHYASKRGDNGRHSGGQIISSDFPGCNPKVEKPGFTKFTINGIFFVCIYFNAEGVLNKE